jgi:sulfoxide reductase catalytic subunit YedY
VRHLRKKAWDLFRESEVTPESAWLSRRALLKAAAASGAVLLAGPLGVSLADDEKGPYPSKRNEKYKPERDLTDEKLAATYNNFYEFTTDKAKVHTLTGKFKPEHWKVEVTGLCSKPQTFDLDDLRKIEHEERVYRFRCVEAWAMVVPWTGFPMSKLLEKVEPTSDAKYVRFVTAHRPDEFPGYKAADASGYSWPYFEGLTLEEAKNELAFFATGIYGKKLPKQHGAPIRAVLPWKYGYKGPKSIAKIELVKEKPETFWHKAYPNEYGFFSNVNPEVPHPRWSQAEERLLGKDGKVPTKLYNGYGDFVAALYKDMKLTKPSD